VLKTARKEKDRATEDTYKLYVMRSYLMLLVGTTIFSNKAKNYAGFKHVEWNAPWWEVGLQGFGG
jgi:hypothetical protein